MDFLRVEKGRIVDNGRPVHLKGVNLGSWLMPEAYFTHAPVRGYRFFKAAFIQELGLKIFGQFEQDFRDNFIVEDDFKKIAAMGFDHVRLPFHYKLLVDDVDTGFKYLNRAVAWASKHHLRVILDMHAVPGAQNTDWHSDSDGRAGFFQSQRYQKEAIGLWRSLAAYFRKDPAVLGYDILNEAVVDDVALLNEYYRSVIEAIRTVDREHILFVEGNRWAQDIASLDDFEDDNLVLGIHFYEPMEFTFNLIPGLKYPFSGFNKSVIRERMAGYLATARQRGRALWCGEFGVNSRQGFYGEDIWVSDVLSNFKAMNIHWSYWTWKSVKNFMFPDGVCSYYPNPVWVNRMGPVSGWDTWSKYWVENRKEMAASWRTEAFTVNKEIIKALWKK